MKTRAPHPPPAAAITARARDQLSYRHIVWDWNGTLLDDVQPAVNAINRMLAARGLPPTDVPSYRATFGFPVRHYYRTIGIALADAEWDTVAREFHDFFLAEPGLHLRPEAGSVLRFCREAGCGLAVLSASEQSILNRMLADAGLAGFFDHVQGVDNLYGHSKLEMGRRLLTQLTADGRALFVGDTLHDHEVATALGCDCLLIAEGHQTPERLLAAGCPVVPRLADVPEFLQAAGARYQGPVAPPATSGRMKRRQQYRTSNKEYPIPK